MTKVGARKRCASPIWGKIGLPLPRFPGPCLVFGPLVFGPLDSGAPTGHDHPANFQVSEAFDLMIMVCDGCKGGMLLVVHTSYCVVALILRNAATHDKGDRSLWPALAWTAWSKYAPSKKPSTLTSTLESPLYMQTYVYL